jgi:predicted RNA-binding Zn ribbon-like protein
LVRPPAPGDLELVRRFINTRNVESAADAIGSPEGLQLWLRDNALTPLGTHVAALDVRRAVALREALRGLARRNNGEPCAVDARVLDAAGARSRLTLGFSPNGSAGLQARAEGVDGALGRILAAVHAAALQGDWPRLKACADESCLWAYYDRSKNGCSRWCSTETCGNRSKVKRYRERRALAAPDAP